MCDPVSASVALGAATVVQTYGQVQAGRARAKLARQQARVQEYAAEDAARRGEDEARRHGQRSRRLVSRQRAGIGASGTELGAGHAADIVEGTQALAELDQRIIRNNAAKEAWGHRVGASVTRSRGQLDENRALYGAAGSLLGGASRTYGAHRVWAR